MVKTTMPNKSSNQLQKVISQSVIVFLQLNVKCLIKEGVWFYTVFRFTYETQIQTKSIGQHPIRLINWELIIVL